MSNAVPIPRAEHSFHAFGTADEMYAALARDVVRRLTAAVAREGRTSFVVPGGGTPGALFDILACSDAPWHDIQVTLTDDRWIETASDRSIENLVRERLLIANAAAARFIPFRTGHSRAQDAESSTNATVAVMHRPFEAVILGMGTDGHIASLIPEATGLSRALDRNDPALVRAVNPPDLAAMGERMTLTLRAILDARWIVLLIRGDAKLAAYRRALARTDALEMPVRAVLHQTDVPVSVFWCR